VPSGVKMDSQGYTDFLTRHFLPYHSALPQSTKKKTIFMHDNAPSHASRHTERFLKTNGFTGNRLMTWPPQSPDLNPIENYWGALKQLLYANGKQYDNNEQLWQGILDAFRKIEPGLIGKLTKSVDHRLMKLFERKGRYINY